MTTPPRQSIPIEPIRRGELYRKAEAIRRLGIGRKGWFRLRREGLRVVEFGGKAFVSGDDILDHFAAMADDQDQADRSGE